MSVTILLSFTLFSYLTSTAVVLPTLIPLDNAMRPPQPLPNPSLPNNVINTTSPPSDVLRIQCNSNYGRNVNPGSCRDVFHYIARTDQENTLAQRNTGHLDAVPLPLRLMSNDGLCFVQPLLKPGSETARASSKQIGLAAYTLFQRCVVEKGLGGIADGIGVSSSLKSVLTSVRFRKEFSRSEPNSMPVTRQRQQSQRRNRGLHTPRPLRQISHERSTLGVLPLDSRRHASDVRSEGVWRQEPRCAGRSQPTTLSQSQ